MLRTKVLAIASAYVVGGFLFSFYEAQRLKTFWVFALLALPVPVLLVVFALLVFGSKHTRSVMLAGFFGWILCIHVVRASDVGSHAHPGGLFESVLFAGPIVSLVGFCLTLALRIGSKRIRHSLYFALLASVVIGASSLAIEIAQRRRIETQELPALLKRIYEAEMSYSAGRPDKGFTCDVTQLPAVSALGWSVHTYPNQSEARLSSQHYTVELVCRDTTVVRLDDGGRGYIDNWPPHRFRMQAWYRNNNRLITFFSECPCHTVLISIDETGELVVRPFDSVSRSR